MYTLDKIISVMKTKKIPQNKLTEHLGLSKSTFSSWKSGKNESYRKYLPEIAEFIGVSVSYLIGEDEKKVDEQLEGIDFALMSETEGLTNEQKQTVLNYIKFLKSQD